MASDYLRITSDNKRDWGEKSGRIAEFLARELYSDRTHFVYELIQNAEDALARRAENEGDVELPTSLRLHLFSDRLEVRHFGALFSEADVRGICGILDGTKAGQAQQIGRFGIGFKSVYSVSATPEVHSGDEHFQITDYIFPTATAPQPTDDAETLFVIPFDHPSGEEETVFDLIARRLRGLGMQTLLFLRHISEIEWQIDGSEWGAYRKRTKGGSDWRIVTLVDDAAQKQEERWVVFEGQVPGAECEGPAMVEIAFQQVRDARATTRRFAAIKPSPLFAYFPTEKDTGLGFLIQGPYNTTPARDNIRLDDPWNRKLVTETAALVVNALKRFRKGERLDVDILQTMPLDRADFDGDRAIFLPIFLAVRKAFNTEELLPTDDGSYTSAGTARIAHSDRLRKLLRPSQLQMLYGTEKPLHWISADISPLRTPQVLQYVEDELGVQELKTDQVTYKLTDSFLRQQSDDWMISFYQFLGEIPSLWRRPGGVGSVPIIRLESGRHVAPFSQNNTPNAYLPADANMGYQTVKRQIADDAAARAFLKDLGLRQPDVCDEVIERILPRYNGLSLKTVSGEEYEADLGKIMVALSTDSTTMRNRVIALARAKPVLRARNNADGRVSLRQPGMIYYPSEDLTRYFTGNREAWFLDIPTQLMARKQVLVDLGVSESPRTISHDSALTPEEKRQLRGGSGCTEDIKVLDYDLDGIDCYLNALSRAEPSEWTPRVALLWRYLRSRPDALTGVYRWQYYTEKEACFESKLAKRLKKAVWLLGKDGALHAPPELDPLELPPGFQRDRALVAALGVGCGTEARKAARRDKEKQAAALGLSLDDVEAISMHRDDFRKWLRSIDAASNTGDLPERAVTDAQRRKAKLEEHVAEAPRKEFVVKARSVRASQPSASPKHWLRGHYTNSAGRMRCQICQDPMPFRGRNGQYYFWATQLFDDLAKESTELYLALCPLCHAKYREFVKSDPEQVQQLRLAIAKADGKTVPVTLGDDGLKAIHFTEQHIHDVKVILTALGKKA